jgi:hypothetical protein
VDYEEGLRSMKLISLKTIMKNVFTAKPHEKGRGCTQLTTTCMANFINIDLVEL